MTSDIKPGKYLAKVVEYGLKPDKNNKPLAVIRFTWQDENGQQQAWNWQGSFSSERAREITVESLLNAGFKGGHPKELGDQSLECFDKDAQCEIVVDMEEWNGKVNPRIKYINRPGAQGGIRDAVEKGQAETMFAGMNIEGILAAAKAKQPAPKKDKTDDMLDGIEF